MAHPALAGLNGVDWVDIRILEELSFLGQDDGYSVPGRQYLAKVLGRSIRTVSRHLTKLCKLGYLQRTLRTYRTADGKLRNQTSLYRVALDTAARIKAFLGTLGQRITEQKTGGTSSSRDQKKIHIKPKRKAQPPQPTPLPSLNPTIFEKIPLLKRWMQRGSTA